MARGRATSYHALISSLFTVSAVLTECLVLEIPDRCSTRSALEDMLCSSWTDE